MLSHIRVSILGTCLGWPDLSSYNIEKFTGPFPASISNKILIVAELYSLGNSYNSILNTYEFVGEDNSAFLIHDAFGTSLSDPNNCTLNAIRAYFTNGTEPHIMKFTFRYSSSKWNYMSH